MNKTMLSITLKTKTDDKEQVTFTLIPASQECPYNEVFFDPIEKVLIVVSKEKRELPQYLEKLDDNGDVMLKKGKGGVKVERRLMSMFYEYRITELEDIKAFVKMHVLNPDHATLKELLK